jgi:serine protease Do
MRNLPRLVAETDIGKEVPVVIWRDGHEQTLNATVGELPDEQKLAAATPPKSNTPAMQPVSISGLGLKLAALSQELRDRFQLGADQKGVVVTDVDQGGAASDRGLKPGDVIVEVQQEEVATPADVIDRVEKARKANRRSVLFLVQNTDGLRWVPLSLATDNGKQPG